MEGNMEAVIFMANEKEFYALVPNKEIHEYYGTQCYDLYSSYSKKFLKPTRDGGLYRYNPRICKKTRNLSYQEQNELFNTVKNIPECYENIKLIELPKEHSKWYASYTDHFEKLIKE